MGDRRGDTRERRQHHPSHFGCGAWETVFVDKLEDKLGDNLGEKVEEVDSNLLTNFGPP